MDSKQERNEYAPEEELYAPHCAAAAYCAPVESHSGPAAELGIDKDVLGVAVPPTPPLDTIGGSVKEAPRETSSSALGLGSQREEEVEEEELIIGLDDEA